MSKEKLIEVCDIYQPKTISKEELIDNGEFDVYGANGIIGKYNKYNHENSEVVVTCRGATCGSVNITKPKSWINGNAMVVSPKTNSKINKKYLYYYLSNMDYSEVINGTAQPQITRGNLGKMVINIPDIKRQDEIVRKLDRIKLIIQEFNDQLTDLDLYVDNLLLSIIRNCTKLEKLEKLCNLHARIGWQGLTKKEYLQKGDYKLITGVDFCDGMINFDKCVYVNKERYEQDKNIQVHNNDILITKDGTIGKIAFIKEIDFPATLNSGVFVLRNNSDLIKNKYLFYLLRTSYFQRFVDKIKTGATIPHLNQGAFYNFEIPIISKNEQLAFLKKVEIIENLKSDIKNMIDDYNKLFDSLYFQYLGDV